MKKIKALIFGILLINCFQIFSQTQSITLTFTGRHYTGTTVQLDSIKIKNITRGGDTVIVAPDTSITLFYTVGYNEIKNDNVLKTKVYPNPLDQGKTTVEINTYGNGKTKLVIYDITGKNITDFEKYLPLGKHLFDVYLPDNGIYLINVINNSGNVSKKIIGSGHSVCALPKIIYKASENNYNIFKSGKFKNGFWYEPGDTLWYIGYAITPDTIVGSSLSEDIPYKDTLIYLKIYEGRVCNGTEGVKYYGHLYPTVEIDGKCWFKENLNVGTMIPGDSNMKDNGIIEKYCYDNDTNNCNEYGGLYQWDEMMQYTNEEGAKGICPKGWHLPTEEDYKTMVHNYPDASLFKEKGSSHWLPGYNIGATNVTGFTARGSGYRSYRVYFKQILTDAPYFSSTELPYDWVWYVDFNRGAMIFYGTGVKTSGFGVRCIKDE